MASTLGGGVTYIAGCCMRLLYWSVKTLPVAYSAAFFLERMLRWPRPLLAGHPVETAAPSQPSSAPPLLSPGPCSVGMSQESSLLLFGTCRSPTQASHRPHRLQQWLQQENKGSGVHSITRAASLDTVTDDRIRQKALS